MARSNHNPSHNNDDQRKLNAERGKIETPRTAPDTERGLTHSPYFDGAPIFSTIRNQVFQPARQKAGSCYPHATLSVR